MSNEYNSSSSSSSFINYDKNVLSKQIREQYTIQNTNNDTQTRFRSSFINVNSENRFTKYSFQYYSTTNLSENNPLLFSGTNRIIIYHPNNNLDTTKKYNIILTNITGDTKHGVVQETICNYPLDSINFDENNPANIFTIIRFTEIVETTGHYTVEDNYVYNKSDYYEIELKNILTEDNVIRSGYVGGSNVNVKIIKKQNDVFPKPNHYKVSLGKTFRNVIGIRLVSTEIPNITYTVNSKKDSNLRNNKLLWINEDEKLRIQDKVLVTDHVFLNSINHYNYINSEHVNSLPGQGSDSNGNHTLSDLQNVLINSNPTENQTSHASTIITEINASLDKERSYYHLTDTTIDTGETVVNTSNVQTFQDTETINDIFKKNRYFTPKKMFVNSYFLQNNYHSIGKTLTAHIESLISSFNENTIRKALPWEYQYYKIYNSRGRQQAIGTNITWDTSGNNPLKYLGYQVFDSLLSNTIGFSDTQFTSTSILTTQINSVKDTTIPKNLLYGTELTPQDPRDATGIDSTLEFEIYPIHNIFLDEGIYNITQLLDTISNRLNTDDIINFDWSVRDWRKSLTPSNKFILHKSNRKRIFELKYDFLNSVLNFYQYKLIPYQHSIANKLINEKEDVGTTGLHFIVNEGYPHVCIRNEGHLFKNGSFVKITDSDNLFNINQDSINQLHNVIVNPVYRIHVRSILPIPMKTYFRIANADVDAATATKLDIHQSDTGNISTKYDKNTPDANYKILLEIYGGDILNFLNKGTVDNMLNYIGSKLSQNYQDQNRTYPPSATETFTKFKNHITETSQETIHNPEIPFLENELFIKYSQALGNSDTLTIGRVVRRNYYSDENGNFELDFELLTDKMNNFNVGDIIVGMESNAISMIMPYYWSQTRFPTKCELSAGYREYLTTQNNFNTHIPNFYWGTSGDKNKTDNSLKYKWYLQEVYNGEISYSIDVDTIPTGSDIVGITNTEVEIMIPVKFALLFGLNNTLGKRLGFKSNKQGVIDSSIRTDKIYVDFKNVQSNTINVDEISIKSSKFVKMYDNKWSNFLMMECYDKVPYNKGDRVYFEDHVINNYLEENYRSEELLIKRVYPLKDWFYSIESRYIHHILSLGKITLGANPFTLVSGSTEITVTHRGHGLNVGDKITIEGATTVLALSVTAANLNVTTSIKRIVDADSYIIEPTIAATPNTNASLGTDPFAIASGSDTITVTHSSHSLTVGTKIVISGSAALLLKYITAANINVTTEIISVTDSNTYTITPSIIATPNSTDSTTGGASVVVSPYVYGGGSVVKITIDYPTTTLGSNPVSISNGSNVITITHTAHGLLAGDIITVAGATTVLADKVLAADLNVTTPITSVTNVNTYTITPLLTVTPDSTTTGGGSAITITHNAAAGVMQRKIDTMRTWFYQNVNKWTNYNIDYKNFIIRNYLYPRVLHGETQVIIHVSKILLKESTGSALSSTIFIPGMTLTHSGSVIGLKVLGITKRKHKTDTLYNEEPVKNINDISNGDYYYVYFQRLSTVYLSGLDAGETVTYTDSSGSTNLRSASGTLVTIAGSSISYVNDASLDYLYYFYLADKTILEYRTPVTSEEEYYIESNNINISDEQLKINPFSGSNDYPYVAELSYDPNHSNIEYGQTVSGTTADAGPFYLINGSNVIRVTHPYHGLHEGDEITITGAATIIASRVTAYNLNVTTKITKVIDETYYNIEPTLDATPNSTTYGGGALVKLEYNPPGIDININAVPITTLQPGDNVYVTNHQKLIPKYYEEGDVIETDELYLNRLKSDYYDRNTDATVDTNMQMQLTGIKNGNYRVLSNLWAGTKSDNYFMNKYYPGRAVLTDIEWTDELSKGFLNQGGKMRVKPQPFPIIGNNSYEQTITKELKKDSVNDDLSFELYSVLSQAITDTYTTDVTTITVKHGVNFRVGGYIIIDPIIYSQHTESTTLHTEQNTITESNIITAIAELESGNFTLTLQFRLLNDHIVNSYVVQKGYASTITGSPSPSSGSSQIGVSDPDYFVVGDIINIGFNSYDSTKTEGDVGYYRELKNIVTAKSGSTLTLQNTLVQTYATGTYVVKMSPEIIDKNILRNNYLATQNVLIRGEWHTKIFYQGSDMMEDIKVKDGEYSEGANAFNKYAQKEIYISGMKGMSIPQLSFDNHSSYITDRTSLNSVTTKTSYQIEQTGPVPDGFYTIYPNIEQDGRDYLMTDNTNISIKGGFYTKNSTPYKKQRYWRDTGFSRTETLTSNTSTLSIGTDAVFGQEINSGERNETQHIQAPTPTANENFGHSVKIFENYLAVGTDKAENGSVYVYYKNQATGVYELQKTIQIISGGPGEEDDLYDIDSRFGSFIEINDKYLAISASYYPDGITYDRGRVYLYKRVGTNWNFLKMWDVNTDFSVTSAKAQFGRKMSLSGDYLIIGSSETGSGNAGSGKVYIFQKNLGGTDNWGHVKTLAYPGSNDSSVDDSLGEEFGFANSMDDDYIAVGARYARAYDTQQRNSAGLAFVYYRHQGGRDQWGLQQTIYAQLTNGSEDIKASSAFGTGISIVGKYLLVGATKHDDDGVSNVGAAYMYYRTGSSWAIQQKIVPDTRIIDNDFGVGVISPSTNYAVMSANKGNKVYVFKRVGTTWTQQSILVNASPISNDRFGWDLAYDGKNILVGANGYNQTSGAVSYGSVFVFNQTNTTNDGNGILSIDDHTSHNLYIDGEQHKLSVDFSFTNNTTLSTTTTTLGSNPIATANGTSTITITHTAHNLSVGDYITIAGATTTNNITAAQINVMKDIASVVNRDSYTVSLPAGTANATGSGGGSAVTIQKTYNTNQVVEHSIDGWRKIYETGRQFNCVVIKGKYLGYGGQVEFRSKENILEHPEGYEVKQVIYENDNPLTPSNKFFINLQKKQTDFVSSTPNKRIIPSSSLYKNLTMLENNGLFTDNHVIGTGGSVYKKDRDAPVNIESDFMNMCVTGLGTTQNTSTNTIDDIFAKILLPSGSGSIYYDTFTSTPKEFYDKPLRELTELEIKFIDSNKNPIEFNGYNHSFTLEIIELDEELLKINPTTGFVE
jgi:hypothetical protein